jgi:hypothetical protein
MTTEGTTERERRVELVAKLIAEFNWGNFGLDEVGEIKWTDADYARELAKTIVATLDNT